MRNLAVLFAVLTHPFYKFSVLKITKSMCDYTVLRDCFLSFAFDFVIIIVIVNIVVVSVTQSCPTLCDPHGLQPARLPCPSPSSGA